MHADSSRLSRTPRTSAAGTPGQAGTTPAENASADSHLRTTLHAMSDGSDDLGASLVLWHEGMTGTDGEFFLRAGSSSNSAQGCATLPSWPTRMSPTTIDKAQPKSPAARARPGRASPGARPVRVAGGADGRADDGVRRRSSRAARRAPCRFCAQGKSSSVAFSRAQTTHYARLGG
jgi:hypothetical protein